MSWGSSSQAGCLARRFIKNWNRRVGNLVGGGVLFAAVAVPFAGYQFIDRSFNYVPVDAIMDSVEHACHGQRWNARDKRYDHVNGLSCERLRTLVETDADYRNYDVIDEISAKVVYRSPVDHEFYLGKVRLGQDRDVMPVKLQAPIKVLASIRDPRKITHCCDFRVDWINGS